MKEFVNTLKDVSFDDEYAARSNAQGKKVNILTTHKSKGLEFDIVFALGIASRTTEDEFFEGDAEKMRMLYVACTRAKKNCIF